MCFEVMGRKIKDLRDSNKFRLDDLNDTQYFMRDNARKQEIVLHESIASLNKAIARRDDSYHTKLFKALGGTIMRSDPDAEGFGHIEFRLSDRSTRNMYDKVDDAGVERQCKSMLDRVIPTMTFSIELTDRRIKDLEDKASDPPPFCKTMKTVRTKTKKK